MRSVVRIPVTVKMRIGVVVGRGAAAQAAIADYTDADAAALLAFVAGVRAAGAAAVIVHARKAVLGGLSPKQNREVPPLRFDVVQRLKREFPRLAIVVNGGLRTPAACSAALEWSDGVMLGREAYHRPQLLAELQQLLFADGWRCPAVGELLERMAAYAEREVAGGERLCAITRHMLGLCAGQPGARRYRQWLSESARSHQGQDRATAAKSAAGLLRVAAALCAA